VLKRIPIRLKLMLLAGVPVLGALVLAILIARDARRAAESAAALGSIEDLANLAAKMTGLVHTLQLERSSLTLETGNPLPNADQLRDEFSRTDDARHELDQFLAERSVAALPAGLAHHLSQAQQALSGLDLVRSGALAQKRGLIDTLNYYESTNHELIGATAALEQLTDDGQMMRAISALVNLVEVKERASQEHAVLNHVFMLKQFPAGAYKELVTLLTEEDAYSSVLEVNASEEVAKRFATIRTAAGVARALGMRKTALETLDDELSVDAREWDRVQSGNVLALRELGLELLAAVKLAAVTKARDAQQSVRLSYGLVGGVILISACLALVVGRGLARSIGSLASAAGKLRRENDFSIRALKTSEDELGALTDAFNEMLQGLQERDVELEQHRENLEQLVQQRTLALERRNAAMRLVLDNVDQGLATIQLDGKLAPERSRMFDEWFGAAAEGGDFAEVLSKQQERLKLEFQLGWEQLVDGFVPHELALDQLPKQVAAQGRSYRLSYKPIQEDSQLSGVLLVASDISSELEHQKREAEQREILGIVERITRDRTGFVEFFEECEAQVASLTQAEPAPPPVVALRTLHTIKGNCGSYGVRSLAHIAHELESKFVETGEAPTTAQLQPLAAAWRIFHDRVRPLLGSDGQLIEIAEPEFDDLITAAGNATRSGLIELLQRLRQQRARTRLQRLADQARDLANRLGKGPLDVELSVDRELRLPNEAWAPFWSNFIHLIRNAIDHGIESATERLERGKPERSKLRLSATLDSEQLCIEVQDDGRGIDWERIREKAQERGLPHQSRADLIEALFSDGVSTAEFVSDTSGRGVGMAAVRDAAQALGGQIEIESSEGVGTTIRFEFPVAAARSVRHPASSIRPSQRPPAHSGHSVPG
jgi:two-component system chemotaxis sensor kinase CheA